MLSPRSSVKRYETGAPFRKKDYPRPGTKPHRPPIGAAALCHYRSVAHRCNVLYRREEIRAMRVRRRRLTLAVTEPRFAAGAKKCAPAANVFEGPAAYGRRIEATGPSSRRRSRVEPRPCFP